MRTSNSGSAICVRESSPRCAFIRREYSPSKARSPRAKESSPPRNRDQMKMVDHQTPRQHFDLILFGAFGQAAQEKLAVGIVDKHRLPVIPPLRDVMRESRYDKTWHSRHAIKCVRADFISVPKLLPYRFGTIIRLRPYFWRSTEMMSSAVITPVSFWCSSTTGSASRLYLSNSSVTRSWRSFTGTWMSVSAASVESSWAPWCRNSRASGTTPSAAPRHPPGTECSAFRADPRFA